MKVKETFSVKQSFCWQTGVYFVEIITVTLSGRCSIFFSISFFKVFAVKPGAELFESQLTLII